MTASLSSPTAASPTDDTTPGPAALSTSRGRTTIAPGVVEKIAVRAAREVDGVALVQTGLSRLLPWGPGDASAGAEAEVGRESVALDLTVSVTYPRPVGRVAAALRDHVIARIEALTGLAVRQVNISVAELVPEAPAPRVH